ncbi:methyltransferase FGSG_00040 [Miscanthus floridulus]|uniref:methyltransferase FGSG_00040 n=1 Tax=Miscanthus floridulus TaxID=154761 RepID=UPI00345AFFE0
MAGIQDGGLDNDTLQHLRSRATELLFKEDWREYVAVCSRIIDAASSGDDRRVLCSTLAHRADARARLGDAAGGLADCDAALAAKPAHPGALLSKGALLRGLGRYAAAADCFRAAALASGGSGAAEETRELAEQCRRLEAQARSGAVDLSEWVLAGFAGKFPDLAEYVGSVEVRRSPHGGRGLFAVKNVEAGATLIIAKAAAIGRGVIPDAADSEEKMFVWKDFVGKVLEAAEKCPKTAALIYTLSTGEERQDELVVPDMAIFRNETEIDILSDGISAARAMGTQEAVHVDRILKVLDVNCLTEDAPAADVLGNNGVVNCGVGLWVLPSFINHSCHPNARRTHIGDHAIVHASRDIKAGEEITFPYFDVLVPVSKRREAAKAWGFECKCDRCRFEAEDSILRQEILKSENDLASGGDTGAVVVRLEEKMRKSVLKERQKAFLRASFWSAYSSLYDSDKLVRKWGRRVPSEALVAESVADAVGGNESVLKAMLRGSRDGNGCGNRLEVEDKVVRIGRATYGKLVKRHAMRDLFRLTMDDTNKINI